MSAREVIAKALREHTRVQASLHCSELIVSALDAAGYAPPLHTGAIHKALQDAFQAGVNEAFAGKYIRPLSDLVALKHKICDGILHELTAAKETP